MSYVVDFHIHTTCSDGTLTPTEIVKKYKEQEYDMIAITDHDTVDGVHDAQVAGEALNLKVIPGIELSTLYDGRDEVHILGYYMDTENERLLAACDHLLEKRVQRNKALLAYLADLGYPLTEQELRTRRSSYVGKPDFVRALQAREYPIEKPWDLLDAVVREMISTEEALDIIQGAGGIPVLAHPMKIGFLQPHEAGFLDRLDDMLRALKPLGLKGMECYHPSATEVDAIALISLAEKHHLHITEGSDFHEERG